MRIPLSPPPTDELAEEFESGVIEVLRDHRFSIPGPDVNGEYVHWDKLLHLDRPDGLSHRLWWLLIKRARQRLTKATPLTDRSGDPFRYYVTDSMQEGLHRLDMMAGGRLPLPHQITNAETRDRYYVSSLMEEAITSSQIEGAATTRLVAKEMLRTGRAPRDRGERMIVNNYLTMRRIGELKQEQLTPGLVFEIHRLVTTGALEDEGAAGRFRRSDEDVVVHDHEGTILHRPPNANELEARLYAMCEFANASTPGGFIHPAVRSMVLHFWLAHDHPFVDGNGRTARALFYWSMLHHGYWLFEFISISTIINRARVQYSQAFLLTETDENDLTYFLLYHLRVIERAIGQLHQYLDRKASQMEHLRKQLGRAAALNARQRALVGHALRHPGHAYTIESHRASHDVVYQTARTDLLSMVDRGLLTVHKEGKAYQFTGAPDLEERLRGSGM